MKGPRAGAERQALSRQQRIAQLVLRHVRHPLDHRRDVRGFCNVCGSTGRFAFNRWVIPKDVATSFGGGRHALAYRHRESQFCPSCGSSHRVRRIAAVLLEQYAASARTLAQLIVDPGFRDLRIAEINAIGSGGSMHAFLSRLPGVSYSEFLGNDGVGETIKGVRNESLMNLSYEAASFDLLLTSDTLEHVPDLDRCIAETFRVLRPGGRHVLTVPLNLWRPTSVMRAAMDRTGGITHLHRPIYHGRGGGPFHVMRSRGDYLAFTDIGADFGEILARAGFHVQRFDESDDETGSGSVYVATVPTQASAPSK